MELPATDAPAEAPANAPTEWLVDAGDPALTDERMGWVADPTRPDRLAWNTFRTLALWEPDTWIPSVLESAIGEGNRLSPLEWSGTQVRPWGAGIDHPDLCDVVLDGPEGYVVVACLGETLPPPEELRQAAIAALDGSLHGGREAGLVVVVGPGAPGIDEQLHVATQMELRNGRLVAELLDGALGILTWPDLGRLALDLVEEDEPLTAPTETVHQLVTELQERFPAAADEM